MNKGKLKNYSALFLCFILLFSSVYTGYSATDNDEVIFTDITDDGTDIPDLDNCGLVVEEDGDNKLVFSSENELVSLSDKYDPRNNNIVTSVKNQNPFGLCWMYATNAMLETFVSKNMVHNLMFRNCMALFLDLK